MRNLALYASQHLYMNLIKSIMTYTLHYATATGRPKGLNCEVFTLFHLGLILVLDEHHRLASMNRVRGDSVPAQVLDGFDCGWRPGLVSIARI